MRRSLLFTPGLLALAVPLALLFGPAGCKSGSPTGNGNDATVPPGDGTADASLLPDGSSAIDNDGDGYPADQDCDDNDETIYPGVRRPCQSDCDVGTEICLADGTWHTCTARTDCDCETPYQTRIIDCGNCGQATQECGLDLKWGMPGTCSNQGECAPGDMDEGTCQLCGVATRRCALDCSWGEWEGCFGVCEPGTERRDGGSCTNFGERRTETCGTTCQWEPTGPCSGDCLASPRTGTSDYSDELCIPGGPFLRGSDPGVGNDDERPKTTIYLSPYFIDVFPVTNARYRACVLAGACTAPGQWASYHEANMNDHPVDTVTFFQAEDFCNWDGGRRLPTEAEWEKAARGPAPREVRNPWGEAPATCEHVYADECIPWNVETAPVWDLPLDVSYYGVRQLGGNIGHWVSDWYDEDYYAVSPNLDPQGPASGTMRAARGLFRNLPMVDYQDSVTNRRSSYPDQQFPTRGFRCARSDH